MKGTLEERFWAKVDRRGPNECWPWLNAVGKNGYGKICRDGRVVSAHRVAFEIQRGPIPFGMAVLHTCDFKLCSNGAHLWTGTLGDNNRDCAVKGRAKVPTKIRRGVLNGRAKLNDEAVIEMRLRYEAGETRAALARAYSVSWPVADQIVRGVKWKHVTR